MVPGNTLTERANTLKAWGFDAIAVFADYSEWSDEKLEELKTLETRTGIVPCEFVFSFAQYGHLMDADPQVRTYARNVYKEAIGICAQIGAVTELEFSYGPVDPLPLFSPYQKMRLDEEEAFLEMYGEMAQIAKGSHALVLLETINRYESSYLNSLDDCLDIVQKLGHENAGVLADLFHMSIEEADMPRSIRKAGKLIKHVHLGDNNRLLPGMGSIDFASCIRALQDIGYDGYISLECGEGKDAKRIRNAGEYLRYLIGQHA
jgi:sugar phosphate isomerase/epimerase